MKAAIVILALIGFVQSTRISKYDVLETQWKLFKKDHMKSYHNESEELLRKQIFKDNMEQIHSHNLRYEAGKESYKMGVNQFTDLLHEEFVNSMMGTLNTTAFHSEYIYTPGRKVKLPESVDWREKKAVSAVKHQGDCGSCWAFAAVGTMEGQQFLKEKKLVELSEQNLLDCSSEAPYKNLGCKGGSPQEALRYVKENHGINTRSSYAYEGHVGKCRFKKDQIGAVITGSVDVRSGDEAALEAAVAEKGPISVTIDATHLQHYQGGVYNTACGGTANYHHSILLIGYGKDPKAGNFWLLKNSWGNWGEGGYFRMARKSNNLCGIATYAVYPLL
ncbi:cathepsin L-like [Drosophila innubila]|uniref:cathepsin L-like n=1 Tax=Drosophila innubila TaxID=198719 RepID=UPI00148B9E17|nr:cathepsin L-like [Drosophila innubila]